MAYYSAIIKEEYLPFTKTLMAMEGIILKEISQAEEDSYQRVMWNIRNSAED